MIESTTHVFRADGARTLAIVRTIDAFATADDAGRPVPAPTIADLVPITDIMKRDVTCATRDLHVPALVRLMVEHRIGCMPVVDEAGHPVGMVTKLDVVEQLLAMEPSADRGTAHELMMPIAITLGPRATVAHAATLMACEDIHHVPIVDDLGRLIGIVSSMDLVRWLAENDGHRAPSR
jgi:CBS domain-containing protein